MIKICKGEEFRNKKNYIVDIVDEVLSEVFGSNSNVIMKAVSLGTKPGDYTKDGYDVMSTLYSDCMIENTILKNIRNICTNQNLAVGDGTTSSVLIGIAMYRKLTEYIDKYVSKYGKYSYRKIESTFKQVINKLITLINSDEYYTTKFNDVSLEDIENLITTTSGDDSSIITRIMSLYRDHGVNTELTVLRGDSGDIYSDVADYYNINASAVSSLQLNNGNANKVILKDNVEIFMFEGHFPYEYIPVFKEVLLQSITKGNKPVFIMQTVDSSVKEFIDSMLGSTLSSEVSIKFRDVMSLFYIGGEPKYIELFKDLAAYLGITPTKHHEFYSKIKEHNDIIDKKDSTTPDFSSLINDFLENSVIVNKIEYNHNSHDISIILNDDYEPNMNMINERIEFIDKAIEETQVYRKSAKGIVALHDLNRRKKRLNGVKTIYLYVDADTSGEASKLFRVYEDCAKITNNALKTGICPASNSLVPKIITNNLATDENIFESQLESELVKLILESYLDIIERLILKTELINKVSPEDYTKGTKCIVDLSNGEQTDKLITSVGSEIEILKSMASEVIYLASVNMITGVDNN